MSRTQLQNLTLKFWNPLTWPTLPNMKILNDEIMKKFHEKKFQKIQNWFSKTLLQFQKISQHSSKFAKKWLKSRSNLAQENS
jgi:hypothetical protein